MFLNIVLAVMLLACSMLCQSINIFISGTRGPQQKNYTTTKLLKFWHVQ